ncbi:MAG: NUDIX hydrolase [Acidimicrobiales bacterium]
METSSPIRASGCLVYRVVPGDGADSTEVLVAHRPHYDDWDFPKGKLEDGETDLECAVRETEEETGFTGEIGEELPTDHYVVGDRPKTVRWWLMRQTGGAFVVNDEVDEVRWVTAEEAVELLSYEHPKSLLAHLPAAK